LSLSDRLNQAKTQRLIAAGVLSSEHALKPDHLADAGSDDEAASFAPITIEVPPTGLHPVAEYTDLGEITATATCPNCNGPAHLDMVDLVGHTNHFSCMRCGAMWQTRESPTAHVTR